MAQDILEWGPAAGRPGTAFDVRFRRSADGWWAEPAGEDSAASAETRHGVPWFPDLRAAAGAWGEPAASARGERVLLPVGAADPDLFAVRVSGWSMDGGSTLLQDGDWAVTRYARGAAPAALEDRVVLVQRVADRTEERYQVNRLRRSGDGWLLVSDSPGFPPMPGGPDATVIARLERVVRPEELTPAVGTVVGADELSSVFGIEGLAPRTGRYGGHLFVFVDRKGVLVEVDRLAGEVAGPRMPGETTFGTA